MPTQNISPTSPRKIAVVIPAGGGGTRLWPRSRKSRPKQFLDIVEPDKTMLQATFARLCPEFTPYANSFVITNHRHLELVREQLPQVPKENIIGEPVGRDSAPAIGIMAAIIEDRLGPETVMAVFPSDHDIRDVDQFLRSLTSAILAAEDGYLVTLGIPPTSPDTGFGYIQRGEQIGMGEPAAYAVKRFKEKPDRQTAKEYLESGEYYWNAGMFIATISTFRSLYKSYLPEMEQHLAEIVAVIGTEYQEITLIRLFPQLTKISFDYAIAEKAKNVAVVPAEIGWSDVGSWTRLAELLVDQADSDGNLVHGDVKLVKSSGNFVHSPDKLIALIGVENLVVIDTPNALLIAPKDSAEEVKLIVDKLSAEGRQDVL